jgi:putative endonuclease
MNNAHLGREGEERAADFLMGMGYEIIERNYRKSFGEIDIVARDGETLCFIEVKTRIRDDYGHPFAAVTPSKQRTIRKLASLYLAEQGIRDQFIRFDVVGVSYPDGVEPSLELLKDAF